MRRVGRATGRSFAQTMRRQWDDERELSAFIQGEFVRHGCSGSAYVPVVAGGRNALSVHYTRNDDRIRDGDLILVDAGGEHGHYIADVTRTFPAGRRFAPAQRDLYEVVLGVQRECVALCRASAGLSLDQIHATAERRLVEGLKGLGFNMSRGVSTCVALARIHFVRGMALISRTSRLLMRCFHTTSATILGSTYTTRQVCRGEKRCVQAVA